ncbi:hypothetical protein V6O07_16680, partial [Arthrospira platensis SPKY2]
MTIFGWGALVVLMLSFWFTKVSPLRLITSFGDIFIIAFRLVPRNLEWFNANILSSILETVAIGIAASTLGLLVSIPLAFLCAR